MKGFLYLVEIVVAAVLVALILGTFFAAQSISTDWSRADLIGVGNNIFDVLDDDILKTINETEIFDIIDDLKPPNVNYELRFRGIPKNIIIVGTNKPTMARSLLLYSYLNNREIKYNVIQFNDDSNFDLFDVLLLNDYNYNDVRVQQFAETKPVIGIESDDDCASIQSFFDLDCVVGGSVDKSYFVDYDQTAKYFNGIGFIVNTGPAPITENGPKEGQIKLWGNTYDVRITSSLACIGNDCTPIHSEGDGFDFGPGLINFYVKKIDYNKNRVYFAIKDDNFEFNSFSNGGVALNGNEIIATGSVAEVTKSGNKIWIAESDETNYEYKTLVQALVASSVMDWYTDEPNSDTTVEVTSFVSLCCDVPEIVEISFVLWYVF